MITKPSTGQNIVTFFPSAKAKLKFEKLSVEKVTLTLHAKVHIAIITLAYFGHNSRMNMKLVMLVISR